MTLRSAHGSLVSLIMFLFGFISSVSAQEPALDSAVTSSSVVPVSAGFGLDSMAPEGHWAARLELRTNSYNARYDNNGKRQDLDAAFDGVNLDASIFPALALFGPGASLGTTALNSRVESQFTILTLGYGLTPNLTLGAILSYNYARTEAQFAVSGGNVGFNPAFNTAQAIGATNFPFAPAGSVVPAMNGASLQNILGSPAFGYGYKPIQTTTTEGVGDPTLGVLWRFHQSERDSLVLGLGVRFGIAADDDPDNLLDVPPGDGSTDIRARLEYFRDLGAGFDLHVLADYNIQMEDTVTLRVPAQGQLLALANSKEKLQRNLGDYYETDFELGYRISDYRFAATWHRYEEGKDTYSSKQGSDTRSLEANTHTLADQYRLSAAWSGVSAWQAGKFPLPLILKLEMQDTFAGRNFVDVRDIYLQITALF